MFLVLNNCFITFSGVENRVVHLTCDLARFEIKLGSEYFSKIYMYQSALKDQRSSHTGSTRSEEQSSDL